MKGINRERIKFNNFYHMNIGKISWKFIIKDVVVCLNVSAVKSKA